MEYWNSSLTIKNLKFPRFIGGPLDGITDSPFRKLVRQYSQQELLYTEMRHVALLANAKEPAIQALTFDVTERPLNFQVAASQVRFIEPAVERILATGVDIVDLNVGCPAKNVISSGSGSALMADLPRLKEILIEFKRCLGETPFTIKIRAGFREKNALEVAQLAQDCGVDALAIHPRLQRERFLGQPDYDLAAQVKRALTIPVIISGNVINWKTASMVYERTGVDGFLIGRGIWGKPWKLHEMREHQEGRSYAIPFNETIDCAIKHLENMLAFYGPHGLFCFRKHLPLYVRGVPEAAAVREELLVVTDPEVVKQRLESLKLHDTSSTERLF